MQREDSTFNEITRTLAGILSYALPVIQFFYQLFPGAVSSIFLDKNIFLTTSILTLIISLLVILWYKQEPYFKIVLFQYGRKKKYKEYINKPQEEREKLPRVMPPKEIRSTGVALMMIPIILVTGFTFIWLGLNFSDANNMPIIFFQAVLYTVFIIMIVFSSMIFYEEQRRQKDWLENKKRRISRALSLAIENNAIDKIPQVQFVSSYDSHQYPISFGLFVRVGKSLYHIITDSRAEILQSVSKIKEPAKSNKAQPKPLGQQDSKD